MKRIIVGMLVAVLAAFTGQAQAAVDGSAHDVVTANTTFGVCSSCHIPHKSVGKRLWPASVGTSTARGDVGNLCGYCHDETTGIIPAARQPLVFKDTTTLTHGLEKAAATGIGETLDSTLPYVSSTLLYMECTSCHNVHDQDTAGTNAFLQSDIDGLCARCHTDRQFVGGAASTVQGAWGSYYGWNATAASGNPGSHPVGTDVYTDTSQHDYTGTTAADPDSPINTTAIGVVDYGARGDYNLGPKLIDGGTTWQTNNGMGCITCHMPHGRDDGATIEPPNTDVLAVNQSDANGRSNGQGDANNALCEACHRGGITGFTSVAYPNPGNTGYSHPVDDYYVLAEAGVSALPTLWPSGDGSENPGGPDIICESCHAPHMLRAATEGDEYIIGSGTNTHLLRADELTFCDNCHTGAVVGHHPVGAGLMDGTLFDDDVIGNGDTDMDCADCHNGNGAHNWSAAGAVGLDPDWEPRDNGRTADTGAGLIVAGTSKECTDCHLPATTRFSPTRGTTHDNFQGSGDSGDASHVLGVPETTLNNWPATSVNTTAIPTGTFVTDVWAGGGWSRFDGTADGAVDASAVLVCESCHELEPDKNAGSATPLLLYAYAEGTDEDRSILCEGCHGATGAGDAAHPQTAEEVGRATLAGRNGTNAALLITATTGYAQRGNRGYALYPVADKMNCDTCHQPHNASTASGTFILEGSAALAEVSGTPDTAVVVNGRTWAAQQYETNATPLDYQNFCLLCHSSGG